MKKTKPNPEEDVASIDWELGILREMCAACALLEQQFLKATEEDDEALHRMRLYLSDRFDFIKMP